MIVLALGVPFLLIIFLLTMEQAELAWFHRSDPRPVDADTTGSASERRERISYRARPLDQPCGHLWGCDRRGRPLQGGLLNGLARRECQRESS